VANSRGNVRYGMEMQGRLRRALMAERTTYFIKLVGPRASSVTIRRSCQAHAAARQSRNGRRPRTRCAADDEPFAALDAQTRELMQAESEHLFDVAGPAASSPSTRSEEDGFVDLMSEKSTVLCALAPDIQTFRLHELARLRVERGEGFVHHSHSRVRGRRPCEIDALLHARLTARRIVTLEALETNKLMKSVRPLRPINARVESGPGISIARYRTLPTTVRHGKRLALLENRPRHRLGAGDLLRPSTRHGAPSYGSKPATDVWSSGRSCRSRWDDDGHELAVSDRERDVGERQRFASSRST